MGKVINLFTRQEVSETEIQALSIQAALRNLSKAARDLEGLGYGTAAMFAQEAGDTLREDMANGVGKPAEQQQAVGENPPPAFTEDEIPF